MLHMLCYGAPTQASSRRPVFLQNPGGPDNTLLQLEGYFWLGLVVCGISVLQPRN